MRAAVHRERASEYLSAPELARFSGRGLTWMEITRVPPGTSRLFARTPSRWRLAVVDAEERGLVEWDATSKRWRLTDEGRAWTREVA